MHRIFFGHISTIYPKYRAVNCRVAGSQHENPRAWIAFRRLARGASHFLASETPRVVPTSVELGHLGHFELQIVAALDVDVEIALARMCTPSDKFASKPRSATIPR